MKFKPGQTPHNKGKKQPEYMSDEALIKVKQTQFKSVEPANHPSFKTGITTPSKDCYLICAGKGKRVRKPKYIYEQHFGPIPAGYVIYHLDGNRYNDDINNLKCISRAELIKLNKNK